MYAHIRYYVLTYVHLEQLLLANKDYFRIHCHIHTMRFYHHHVFFLGACETFSSETSSR